MKLYFDNLLRPDRPRLIVAAGFILSCIWLLWAVRSLYFPPTYYPYVTNGMSYEEVLKFHRSTDYLSYPLVALFVFNFIGILLILRWKWWVILVVLPLECFLCSYVFIQLLNTPTTTHTRLNHVDNIEFENHTYNLAKGFSWIESLETPYWEHDSLILFECSLENTNCYGKELIEWGKVNSLYATIQIDEKSNQLQVFATDGYEHSQDFTFTLNAGESLRD